MYYLHIKFKKFDPDIIGYYYSLNGLTLKTLPLKLDSYLIPEINQTIKIDLGVEMYMYDDNNRNINNEIHYMIINNYVISLEPKYDYYVNQQYLMLTNKNQSYTNLPIPTFEMCLIKSGISQKIEYEPFIVKIVK